MKKEYHYMIIVVFTGNICFFHLKIFFYVKLILILTFKVTFLFLVTFFAAFDIPDNTESVNETQLTKKETETSYNSQSFN